MNRPQPHDNRNAAASRWSDRPPRKKMSLGKKIVLGSVSAMVVLGALAMASTGSGGSADADTPPAGKPSADVSKPADDKMKDVTLGKFTVTDHGFGFVEGAAKVAITNHSSKTSDYSISIEFLDKNGDRLHQEDVHASEVRAGQKAWEKAGVLLTSDQVKNVASVKVTDVDRYAASSSYK